MCNCDVSTDFQVYNPDKQLVISFPSLEVGDVYEVKWTVRGKNPEFGDNFFARYNFGDDRFPAVRDELHIVLPKDKPFHYATINGKVAEKDGGQRTEDGGQATVNLKVTEIGEDGKKDGGRRTDDGGKSADVPPPSALRPPSFSPPSSLPRRHYHWWVTNKPALPQDDEKPSLEEMRLQVAFSTYANWEAVGRWKDQLRAECWKCTPGLEKVIADVAGPQTTPEGKAKAVTYWVRRRVRYLSRARAAWATRPTCPNRFSPTVMATARTRPNFWP